MRGVPLRYSFRNLLRRPGRTLLTLAGLSLVVSLIVFLVAFGRSFGRALRLPGDPQTLIVLSKKAQTFELSSIPAFELDLMENDVAEQLEADPAGDPLFSKEVYAFSHVRLLYDEEEKPRRALIHGIDPKHVERLLMGFRLLEGRLPEPNSNEIVVGRAVARKLRVPEDMLEVESGVKIRDTVYDVVGRFEAPGTLYENWMVTSPGDLSNTLGRRDFSFARMKVLPDVDLAALAKRLNLDERYKVRVLPETEYFADFTEGFGTFQKFAVFLAIVLGVGGLLTGMNTLHNAVAGRIREIGMLRVLGFGKSKVFVAFLVEALVLTGIAGAVGTGLGVLTNGIPLRIPFATFPLVVDTTAVLVGFGSALLMGALGLAVPLFRALEKPPVEAVRAV
ncbi:MAG: ABC transporter permease [Planctomycetota bacterium]|jgi:ABC-type antimicrobial peptide transport system permease subunit